LVLLAVDLGIIKKSGSWFSYGEVKLGQGIDSVKKLMIDNIELMDEIEAIIRTKYK
jgi:recombination protein RecA